MDFEPKDNRLWFHIVRDFYSGLAAYAIVVALAFVRDFLFKNTRVFSRGPLRSPLSPVYWYSAFQSHYRDTHFFYYVEFVRLAANIAVCTLYVIGTYQRDVPTFITVTNRVLASFLTLDILSHVLAAESALSSVLSLYIFFDVFSFPSLWLSSGSNAYLNFSFLRSIGAYGAYSRLEKRLFVKLFGSKRLIVKLGMQSLTLFYALAAGIQLLEIPGDLLAPEFRVLWDGLGDWNFFNSVYFIVVTLSTVGYGDFSPSTIQGRIYVIFVIIVGIALFGTVIGELIEQSSRVRGAGWFVKDANTRHVIITGSPTLADLGNFISEFYSDSQQSNASAKIVVLVENPSWAEAEWFQKIARNQFLQSRLMSLIGSVRNPTDLQRARISTADAVFFLTSPSCGEDPALQDARTVMNILAIRNVRTDIPIYAQTLLQDSRIQTQVALKTPCCTTDGTYFRESVMRKSAAYPGLFHEILRTEFESIPKAYRKKCFKDVLELFEEKKEQDSLEADELGVASDLQRSELVCLQDTHMALISGNINVNGVGTLLSNMYLDVQAAKLADGERAWLAEYNMGAACSLSYAIIPKTLHSVPIRDVAMEMYHNGLVLVATSNPKRNEMNPVLSVDGFFRSGDIGMFLTYHGRHHVGAALNLVGMRLKNGDLHHPLGSALSSHEHLPDSLSLDMGTTRHPEINGALADGALMDNNVQLAAASTPALPIVLSSDNVEGSAKSSSDVLGKNLLETREEVLELHCSDGYMPDHLTGHVIIAMHGEATLGNLPSFLRNLWHKDERQSKRRGKKAVVVVLHPSIPEQYRSMFSDHERKSLFFVEGSPSSGDSWRRAKLRTAKSVALMSDYTDPWHVADARTIFTLLTLDVRTANDHDLFICSELLDEKSLEFLREPTHPRRRGAILGESVTRPGSATSSRERMRVLGTNTTTNATGNSDATAAKDTRVVTFEEAHDRARDPSGQGSGGVAEQAAANVEEEQEADGERVHAPKVLSTSPILAPLVAARIPILGEGAKSEQKDGGRASKARLSAKKGGSVKSGEVKAEAGEPSLFGIGDDKTRIDPSERPGAARLRRSSLFARTRYASGELLIHSSAITLLAREYVEPGFAKFFTNLLGTDPSSPGLKIRLVRIPKALFQSDKAVTRKENQRLIPYGEVVQTLFSHGVTALGIYRSGNAPALIPTRSRRKRGKAIMDELAAHIQQEEGDVGRQRVVSLGAFGSLAQAVGDVAPNRVKEAQGRTEIHGGQQSSESSEDDDELEESVDDDENGKTRVVGDGTHIPSGTAAGAASSPRRVEFIKKFISNTDKSYQVPGPTRYRERPVLYNLLPYVYTLPDPNTLCAEEDGIYVLCHPSFDLSSKWLEGLNSSD